MLMVSASSKNVWSSVRIYISVVLYRARCQCYCKRTEFAYTCAGRIAIFIISHEVSWYLFVTWFCSGVLPKTLWGWNTHSHNSESVFVYPQSLVVSRRPFLRRFHDHAANRRRLGSGRPREAFFAFWKNWVKCGCWQRFIPVRTITDGSVLSL